ncbi:hypothetical protein AB0478_03395 [Streptomyces sp. NPDC051917]|uniref:hypothetical protein n=1 Tax=Streptomyces sp. NPDC051917 TaxID=3154754 RepID=UPI003450214A
MTRMNLRRRVAAVAIGAVAIGAVAMASTAGAAVAAEGQATPSGKGGTALSQNIAKQDHEGGKGDPAKTKPGKPGEGKGGVPKPGPASGDEAAVAKDLGVTVAQLDDALRATKEWFGTSGADPTPEAFAAHVASILHVPADKVLKSFEAHGLIGDKGGKPGDGKGGKGGKGGKPGDGKGGKPGGGQNQPNLDKAAKDLGVTRAALENALTQTKRWVVNSGQQPTPELFAGHVATILGKNADVVLKVLESDGFFGPGPVKSKPAA